MRDRLLAQIQTYMEQSFPSSANTVTLTQAAYERLAETVSTLPPESGAAIGGPADQPALISQVWFDRRAGSGNRFYIPSTRELEETVARWNQQNCRFRGIVHSHQESHVLSPADVHSGTLLLEANGLPHILLGVFHAGTLSMYRLSAAPDGQAPTLDPLSVTVISAD